MVVFVDFFPYMGHDLSSLLISLALILIADIPFYLIYKGLEDYNYKDFPLLSQQPSKPMFGLILLSGKHWTNAQRFALLPAPTATKL
jgi:hypothetical protein